LSKAYISGEGTKQIILENVNLHFQIDRDSSSFISIIAPLGSGKTTLLKIIAGLETYEGEVTFNSKKIMEPCGIIYIPERSSVLPWLTVRQNIELPAKLSTGRNKKTNSDVDELIASVGLNGYEDFYPSSSLSGFQFRIAIARALSVSPKLILLDDVLKNLDSETCVEAIELLKIITNHKKVSFLSATTNILDSILLSDKVFLMRKNPGRIIGEINIPKHTLADNSEIITKYKNEIETVFNARGMFQSVLVSL
jgi:NitT/TauT family transport system ATP-binding protein